MSHPSIIDIKTAVELLQRGEVVGLPTETVYGLAGRVDSPSAIAKIFAVKARPTFDPLIVHISRLEQVELLVKQWSQLYQYLAKEFWPGPLTLISEKSEAVDSQITSGLDTVAIRWARHPVMQKVLDLLQVPVAAPSANRFGKTSPSRADHVVDEFNGRVPVVDGGPCEIGLESTVVRADEQNKILWVLRPGDCSSQRLGDIAKTHGYSLRLGTEEASPGHLKDHYQPDVPLILIHPQVVMDSELESFFKQKLKLKSWNPSSLELDKEAKSSARSLYSSLRQAARTGNVIVCHLQNQHFSKDWEAILDRLQKASSLIIPAEYT